MRQAVYLGEANCSRPTTHCAAQQNATSFSIKSREVPRNRAAARETDINAHCFCAGAPTSISPSRTVRQDESTWANAAVKDSALTTSSSGEPSLLTLSYALVAVLRFGGNDRAFALYLGEFRGTCFAQHEKKSPMTKPSKTGPCGHGKRVRSRLSTPHEHL